MCGIAGIVDPRGRLPSICLPTMRDRLRHRGPDDAGTYFSMDGTVGLAHCRLAILDLSPRGHQPMATPDGRLTMVFNGEIYNFLELRRQLEADGIVFQTDSDTEVLLRGYERWGEAVLDKVIGMFAFACWDDRRKELFVARDRVGKKPLVYYWDGSVFAFASEVKALTVLPCLDRRLSPQAVDAFLLLGYIPAPLAIFRDAAKLLPGHFLRIVQGRMEIRRYWFPERSTESLDGSELVAQCRDLIQDAVRLRLRSDVPVGLFLSGGVDSSVIAAECVRQGQPVTALTVAFDHDNTDLPYARSVAERLGMPHEVIQVDASSLIAQLQNLLWHYDEPFADTSSVPSLLIAQAARRQLKVVLNGDGGDEAFGGYSHYEHVAVKQGLKRIATALRIKDGNCARPWQVYFQSKALFRRSIRRSLSPALDKAGCDSADLFDGDPYLGCRTPLDPLKLALWGDRHIYLSGDLLYKMDIALMSQGIEGRSPFLDHRLLEWAQRLPNDCLVVGRSKKRLLREAYRDDLPREVLDRAKQGFGSPIRNWLRGPLRALSLETLPCSLLDDAGQRAVLDDFARTSSPAAAMRVWTLLMFSLWANQWSAAW